MGVSNNEILENAAFIFNTYKGDIRVDQNSMEPGKAPILCIKVNPDETQPLKYAYQYGDGLILIKNVDIKKKSNVLGEFLKIKTKDINGYLNFFQNYGFLFNTPIDRFAKIKPETIIKIAERLKATVELINSVNNYEETDYRRIMELCLYLLFDEGWEFKCDSIIRRTYQYGLSDLISNKAFDSVYENYDKQEEINTGVITIEDSIFGSFRLKAKDYHNIINGCSTNAGYDDFRFKALTYLFINYNAENSQEKEFIDLLFHYYYEIGIPATISFDKVEYFSRYNYSKLTNEYIDSILDLAKFIIKREIDSNIEDIHPTYNEELMRPDWSIGSLLSAMYFSLFYLDSKKEMLRRCQHCGGLFVVKRSTSTRIYCDNYCRNNAQAAKHRLKVKSQKS